jgi:hypothetical protein
MSSVVGQLCACSSSHAIRLARADILEKRQLQAQECSSPPFSSSAVDPAYWPEVSYAAWPKIGPSGFGRFACIASLPQRRGFF